MLIKEQNSLLPSADSPRTPDLQEPGKRPPARKPGHVLIDFFGELFSELVAGFLEILLNLLFGG